MAFATAALFAWFCLRRRILPARLVCGLSCPLWRNFEILKFRGEQNSKILKRAKF
ncbi:hypothetical protein [uncultured Campylobacter sp.]|uniref:hypothetical protein n=1 Tax=uncultured Campylobacter sp. TaxID=218934 RepID=UPI002633FF24|nr:hypothetical protein [uncultured Campylobacter sp.]